MKALLILAALVATAPAAPDGKLLFTTNCSACHLLDEMVVHRLLWKSAVFMMENRMTS